MDKIALIALKKSGAPDISAAIAAKEAAQAAQEAAETAQAAAEAAAASFTVDSAMSDSSTNPVQNKVINAELSDLKSHVSATEIVVQSDSQPIVQIADGSANNAKSYDVQIVPQQAGSGDPSPTNVRPISGWTGAEVKRRGFNQFDKTSTLTTGFLYYDGDKGTGSSFKYTDYIPIVGGQRYRVNGIGGDNPAICWYDADKNFINGEKNNEATSKNITFPVNARYTRISFPAANVDVLCLHLKGDGSRDGEYEPYSGADYSIDFPQSAGTVYGGSLHVNEDGSGTLVVDKASMDYGDVNWGSLSQQANGVYYMSSNSADPTVPNIGGSVAVTCDSRTLTNAAAGAMPANAVKTSWGRFYYTTNKTTKEDAIAEIEATPVQVIYNLATPQTYTLTAPQIALLLGTNNIWADAGNMAVEYIADTKLYIQTLTGHPDEDMTADANITSGSFFMIGNTLYLATANIANGSTVVPGTNCTQMSLAAALNSINA